MSLERLLDSIDVAELLMIHQKVVERMAARGEIPGFKVGRFWRYRASDLETWMNSKIESARQPCRIETSK